MDERTLLFLQRLFSNMASVDLQLLSPPFEDITAADRSFRTGATEPHRLYEPLRALCRQTKDHTFYLVSDSFFMHYILFRSQPGSEEVLSVGPYASTPLEEAHFAQIMRLHSLSALTLEQIRDFLCNLPVFDDNLRLISALSTVLEYTRQGAAYGLEYRSLVPETGCGTVHFREDFDERVHNTEKRYRAEQALLDCITNGDSENCTRALRNFRSHAFSPRLEDTLREKKNLSFTANAMYRKAAQLGAVHPYHLHRLSSRYARSIEQCTTVPQVEQLGERMAQEYCLLVKRKSVGAYSPVIQQVLNHIEFHLGEPLSLSAIAHRVNISPPYLSSLFKKELGSTLTDYVNNRRISSAQKLLRTTDLQVQDVALYAGIDDVNYFTKLFKRRVGCTPREYRKRLL